MLEYSKEKVIEKTSKNRNGSITFFDSASSTNTYLRENSLNGKASVGDVVIADTQTGGRGRLGRSFSSPRGVGIYMSYLFGAGNADFEEISTLTARCAVSVRQAILECCKLDTKIKWVNDLVYDRKKLCGILTEMSTVANCDDEKKVIIGIGINVNNEPSDFPCELSDIATSIKIIIGKEVDRSLLCAKIIEKLDKLQADFPNNKGEYLSKYRENCAILGQSVIIERMSGKNGEKISRTGVVRGISDSFGLVVEFEGAGLETITDGDVSVRGFYGVK